MRIDCALLLAHGGNRERLRSILNGLSDALVSAAFDPSSLLKVIVDIGDDLLGRSIPSLPAAHDPDIFEDLDALIWECLGKIPLDTRERVVVAAIRESHSITLPAVLWQRIA